MPTRFITSSRAANPPRHRARLPRMRRPAPDRSALRSTPHTHVSGLRTAAPRFFPMLAVAADEKYRGSFPAIRSWRPPAACSWEAAFEDEDRCTGWEGVGASNAADTAPPLTPARPREVPTATPPRQSRTVHVRTRPTALCAVDIMLPIVAAPSYHITIS